MLIGVGAIFSLVSEQALLRADFASKESTLLNATRILYSSTNASYTLESHYFLQGENSTPTSSAEKAIRKVAVSFPVTDHHNQEPQEKRINSSVVIAKSAPRASVDHRYHEWGEKHNHSARIQLLPLLQLINKTFEANNLLGPFPAFVAIHNNKPTMWISSRTMKWKQRIREDQMRRLGILLPHFQRALQIQLYQHQEQFPALIKALTTVGSIPLFFDLSDYLGCCNPNNTNDEVVLYNSTSSTPVAYFTMSKPALCNFGFPIPSSYTYKYATTLIEKKHRTWQRQMNAWNKTYPLESKIPQVYWSGVQSGRFLKHRLEFLQKVVADDEQQNVTSQKHSIFNVHPTWRVDECDPGKCPSVKQSTPQEEPMKYKATFDIDGHSWSERFPRLLCYNSPVIKIDVPHENEEYFMGHTVFPGIHYIPADLDNFTQVARMVLDPSNDEMLREVVRNANAWCVERLNEESLNLDFLSVLNGYVETLDEGWMEGWKQAFSAHVGPGVRDGHGGFHSTVVDNRQTQHIPTVKGLEGPTPWRLDKFQAPPIDKGSEVPAATETRHNIRTRKGSHAVRAG